MTGHSTAERAVLPWLSTVKPPLRSFAWLLGLTLALSVGAASALNPAVAGLIMVGAGAVLLVALPAPATLAALVIAFLLPLTQLGFAIDTRLLTPIFLVPLTVKVLTTRRNSPRQNIALRLVPLSALAMVSLTWSSDARGTGIAALALLAVVACLLLVPVVIDGVVVLQTLRWLVGALIIISAIASLTPVGQLAGRSRGIFGNPNALAILLVLAAPLLMRGRWRLILPLAVVLAFNTASRAGMAALVVGVMFYALSARTTRLTTRVLAILLVVVVLTAGFLMLDPGVTSGPALSQTSEVSVFRYANSRYSEWATAVHIWRERPLDGHGFGALKVDTASSYLKLLVDLGLLGLLTAAPFLFLLIRRLVTSNNPLIVASIASSLVSSVFEAWLLTAGSAFFILLCLIIQTEEEEVADGRHDP